MARRTVVEESGPGYVEDDSGPVLGLDVGLLVAAAVVVLAVLFFTGTFDDDDGTPKAPGVSPTEQTDQQSDEPQPTEEPTGEASTSP